MIDEILLVFLGLLVAFNFGHFMTLKRCEAAVMALTVESPRLTNFDPSDSIEAVREELSDLVSELMQNFRTPTVADHLGGVIAQFAQMRMMKMLQAEGMLPEQQATLNEPRIN